MNNIEIIETQNEIIKLQSDVINDLFRTLSNYMTLEEIDKMESVKKINLAAQIKSNL